MMRRADAIRKAVPGAPGHICKLPRLWHPSGNDRRIARGGNMRRTCLRIGLVACLAAAPALACAQGAPDLRQPAGPEWPAIGGDWSNLRYSTLTQINRDNVKNLKGAWVVHLGSGLGPKYSLEGTPVVRDGVLYVSTGNDDVYAFDARTGALIWEHRSGIDQNITTVCC